MMTSERPEPGPVFVWTWLPGESTPVVAGRMDRRGTLTTFTYGTSYLARPDALSLYGPELPLERGPIDPTGALDLAGCLSDATPDGWGRRVIETRLGVPEGSLTEFDYMLESGSNRFGAVDFQASPTRYVARENGAVLDDLHAAALRVQAGEPLPSALEQALIHGTSIGGARPKVLVTDPDGVEWIAKLSATGDHFPVVNAEAAAMYLAGRAGLDVPDVQVTTSLNRDVLLVRRFDRSPDGTRRHTVSGLTMSGEPVPGARYVTYPGLLDVLRAHATAPGEIGPRLFRRIAFNIAISNSDDHARNHAAFWDGVHLDLTPAYDLAPGPRSGHTASQAIAYGRDGERESTFAGLVTTCDTYGLSASEARTVVDEVIAAITDHWTDAVEFAHLASADATALRTHQFLNPGCLHGYTT